jgi:hypothetical protein
MKNAYFVYLLAFVTPTDSIRQENWGTSLEDKERALQELFNSVTYRLKLSEALERVYQTGADINWQAPAPKNDDVRGSTILCRFIFEFGLHIFTYGTEIQCPIDIFNDLLAAGANPLIKTYWQYHNKKIYNDVFEAQRMCIECTLDEHPNQQQWMAELYLAMALSFIEKTPSVPREKCIEILQYAEKLAAKPILNDPDHSPEKYKELLQKALTFLNSYRRNAPLKVNQPCVCR